MSRRGIVIANTGSPAAPTPEAVRAYLHEFLTDPRICPMHPRAWNLILNAFILPRRCVASAAKYTQIWTNDGSPLSLFMESLAHKLQAAFAASGDATTIVRHAMNYGEPSMQGTLGELMQEGCDELVIVPLYPQSAHSTTGSTMDKVEAALTALDWAPALRVVTGYSDRDDYQQAIVQLIRDAGFDATHDRLLMAFHSIPMRDIEAGDTYDQQAYASCTGIAQRLDMPDDSWRIAFQCRFDKSRSWLGPTTTSVLQELHRDAGRLFVVTPNFSIDCLETLYDVEVELRKQFLELDPNVTNDDFVYVPCLNDSDAHVALLRAIARNEMPRDSGRNQKGQLRAALLLHLLCMLDE